MRFDFLVRIKKEITLVNIKNIRYIFICSGAGAKTRLVPYFYVII